MLSTIKRFGIIDAFNKIWFQNMFLILINFNLIANLYPI